MIGISFRNDHQDPRLFVGLYRLPGCVFWQDCLDAFGLPATYQTQAEAEARAGHGLLLELLRR